jgi:hypothetical protein
MTAEEKWRVCIHEAGHVVVYTKCYGKVPGGVVLPSDGSVGGTAYINDRPLPQSKEDWVYGIAVECGGRDAVAEAIARGNLIAIEEAYPGATGFEGSDSSEVEKLIASATEIGFGTGNSLRPDVNDLSKQFINNEFEAVLEVATALDKSMSGTLAEDDLAAILSKILP